MGRITSYNVCYTKLLRAEKLADNREISEVYSVSGTYDLIAIVRVAENEELARLVTDTIARIEGIRETETMLAFRAYSRHSYNFV